jgi:hypothetical protein
MTYSSQWYFFASFVLLCFQNIDTDVTKCRMDEKKEVKPRLIFQEVSLEAVSFLT